MIKFNICIWEWKLGKGGVCEKLMLVTFSIPERAVRCTKKYIVEVCKIKSEPWNNAARNIAVKNTAGKFWCSKVRIIVKSGTHFESVCFLNDSNYTLSNDFTRRQQSLNRFCFIWCINIVHKSWCNYKSNSKDFVLKKFPV